jgi:PAS domain S-box-containing protein
MHAETIGVVVHRDGIILEANGAFAELFGIASKDAATGRHVLDFVAPEARARVAAVIVAPPSEVLEYDCLREDGQPVIVRGEGFDLDYHGEPARVTMLTPIAREGVTADRLHQASAFFRLAFEHAPIGKALVSPEGRILAVNRVLSELVGVAAEQLLGRPYNVLAHPDDPDIGPEHAARLLNGESSGYRIERRYVHAQGHVIRVQISVSLVR